MHGMFRKSGETVKHIYRSWGIGVFALPVLVVIALVGMVVAHSDTSNWMSEAVQAGFAGSNASPAGAPRQLAQPAMEIHSSRAN
jgi:hypothetical protein